MRIRPLTPRSHRWVPFLEELERRVDVRTELGGIYSTCRGNFDHAIDALFEAVELQTEHAAVRTLEKLAMNGAGCDCEILFNCDTREHDDETEDA